MFDRKCRERSSCGPNPLAVGPEFANNGTPAAVLASMASVRRPAAPEAKRQEGTGPLRNRGSTPRWERLEGGLCRPWAPAARHPGWPNPPPPRRDKVHFKIPWPGTCRWAREELSKYAHAFSPRVITHRAAAERREQRATPASSTDFSSATESGGRLRKARFFGHCTDGPRAAITRIALEVLGFTKKLGNVQLDGGLRTRSANRGGSGLCHSRKGTGAVKFLERG